MKTPKNPKITTSNVKILNPHDSQGNHVTDSDGIYPCLRGCGGAGYQQGYVLQHIVMYGREDSNTDQHDGGGQGNEG